MVFFLFSCAYSRDVGMSVVYGKNWAALRALALGFVSRWVGLCTHLQMWFVVCGLLFSVSLSVSLFCVAHFGPPLAFLVPAIRGWDSYPNCVASHAAVL